MPDTRLDPELTLARQHLQRALAGADATERLCRVRRCPSRLVLAHLDLVSRLVQRASHLASAASGTYDDTALACIMNAIGRHLRDADLLSAIAQDLGDMGPGDSPLARDLAEGFAAHADIRRERGPDVGILGGGQHPYLFLEGHHHLDPLPTEPTERPTP